jgi:hypothetical protein
MSMEAQAPANESKQESEHWSPLDGKPNNMPGTIQPLENNHT